VRLIGRDRLLRSLAAGQFLAALSAGATGALPSSWPRITLV